METTWPAPEARTKTTKSYKSGLYCHANYGKIHMSLKEEEALLFFCPSKSERLFRNGSLQAGWNGFSCIFAKGAEHLKTRRDEILTAAMRGVREYGLEGVRIQHIAELSGCSAGNIYSYFSSKDELLQACYEQIDRQIAHIFDKVRITPEALLADPIGEVRQLWTAYWRWLVSHPDETVFYHRFRDWSGFPAFEKTRDISYFASFIQSVGVFKNLFPATRSIPDDLLWLHLLTTTVMYAKYVAQGVLPNIAATEEMVFCLLMGGLRAVAGAPQTGQVAEDE